MRKISEIFRQRFELKRSYRDIARSLNISISTVADYLARARVASLAWPLPEGITEEKLYEQLFLPASTNKRERVQPDWEQIHRELRKKGVTLRLLWREYRDQHSERFNLLITGPTGCGKTYIACALAHRACLDGFTSRYYRLPRLWEELKIAKANGTYTHWLMQLAKIDLLLLDDWGIVTPDIERRQDLLEILDDRYQKKSTIVTSQVPIEHWYAHLNDATLADAILDRLLHNAIKLSLKGDSMRKNQKGLQQILE